MSWQAHAEDAVAIRRVRARGIGETALRQQLAAVATRRVRRYVLVRRVTIRARAEQIGQAMEAALAKLADAGRSEVLAFADFPALAVACARAALGAGIGTAWQWRALGLPAAAGPGEAIGTLLAAHPQEAGSAVAALAAEGLLARVWRDLPEAVAARLTAALAQAAGFPEPAWPAVLAGEARMSAGHPGATSSLLARADALWAPILAPLPPRSEAVRTAAVLALLRWLPGILRSDPSGVWPQLLARIAGREALGGPRWAGTAAMPAPLEHVGRPSGPGPPRSVPSIFDARPDSRPASGPGPFLPAPAEIGNPPSSAPAHGQEIATGWGGVLFLINALARLDIEARLAAAGPDAPTGWRLLLGLGVAFGLPEDEPMARFLAAEDLETVVPAELLAGLLAGIEELYRPDGPWPLPLAQAALLRASETHLDLELAATSVDLALRLAGLDLDPGWVPWLGRVVRFHYLRLPTCFRQGG